MDPKKIPTLCLAILIALGFLTCHLYKAPHADYNDPNFDLRKAEEHLQNIAQKPHPLGNAEHERVRNYIVDQAISMGYTVQIDTLVDYQNYHGYAIVSDIKNIIVSKKGTQSNGTIAFAAHYDSQPNTPGAADDATPIANMLSIMETIKDQTFDNDLVFIITDGEETGLSGAALFTSQHTSTSELKYLFNFEARGNSGPLLAFEPNELNNHIMDIYLDLDYSLASSLMYDIYKLLPNDTDFTHFKKLDIDGISMAMIDGFVHYHSMTDTPENIDKSSVYHFGKMMAQLIEKLGNDTLETTRTYDMTYFNTIGYHSVQYRPIWNIIMLGISFILFIFYIPTVIEKVKVPHFIGGFLGALLVFLISLFAMYLFSRTIEFFYPHYTAFYRSNFYNAGQYFLGFAAISTLVYHLFCMALHKKKNYVDYVHLGSLIILFICSIFSLVYIPTGSYILIVPLFFFLCFQQLRRFSSPKKYVWIHTAAAIVPILILMPTSFLVYILFSIEMAIIPMALYGLTMFFLIPLFKVGLRLWTMLLISLVVVSLIRGHMSSTISEEQPYQANWTYYDGDASSVIKLNVDRMTEVEKKYFPEVGSVKHKKEVERELNIPIPIEHHHLVDTINGQVYDVIRISTDQEVIRLKIWGDYFNTSDQILLRDQTITLRKDQGETGIIFYGDVTNQDLELKVQRPKDFIKGKVTVQTCQRGLIDKIAKDGTIIPGVGYNGGTIIHWVEIDI